MIEEQGLANRIFALRQAAKISQEELGAQIGVSKSGISSFEKGKSSPSIDSLLGLARAFDTTVDYLLTGKVESLPLGIKRQIGDGDVDAEDTARHRLAVAVQVMRLQANLSVGDAAEKIGITEAHLKRIEIGEEYITDDILAKIHGVYGEERGIPDEDVYRYHQRLISNYKEREQAFEKEIALLRDENKALKAILNSQDNALPLTPDQWRQAMSTVVAQLSDKYAKDPDTENMFATIRANAEINADELTRVYRIGVNHPKQYNLADRLGITQDEARELVLSGQIRSKYFGPENDRALRNSGSYLITERSVREFLGDFS